ncbi:hypothetical protein ACLOJK_004821, partial [Asimina triloba]
MQDEVLDELAGRLVRWVWTAAAYHQIWVLLRHPLPWTFARYCPVRGRMVQWLLLSCRGDRLGAGADGRCLIMKRTPPCLLDLPVEILGMQDVVADRPRRCEAAVIALKMVGPGIASACHARTGLEGCTLLHL